MKIESTDAFIPQTNMRPSSYGEAEREVLFKKNQTERDRKSSEISMNFINKAVEKANQTMEFQHRQLEFKIHEKTKEIIVKVVDSDTKEVIREIPPEKLLDMFASVLEMAGLLVDERR